MTTDVEDDTRLVEFEADARGNESRAVHPDWLAWPPAPASPSTVADPPSVRAFLEGTP